MDTMRDVFVPQGVTISLPPPENVLELIHKYLQTVNRLFPIYDEEAFVALFTRESSEASDYRCGLWATVNVMIAFSLKDALASRQYFQNARSTLACLMVSQGDLLSIQALLAMVRDQSILVGLHKSLH
jgi:hypothetical protein